MTYEEFYGSSYAGIKEAERLLLELIRQYPGADPEDVKPIIYCCSRIKSPESMIKKLEKKDLPVTCESALREVYDAVGVRIVCAFAEDVYQVAAWLSGQSCIKVAQRKDYIAYPKPNGYRSYHMRIELETGKKGGCLAEIQIRTIAIDFWAALEHQLKYKKNMPHEGLIQDELKRCADEIASVDLSMQTLREIIRGLDG